MVITGEKCTSLYWENKKGLLLRPQLRLAACTATADQMGIEPRSCST